MSWIVAKMKWIMIVCGLLTCTMLYAAAAPGPALQSMFGATLQGPVAEIVVRSWGTLIALMGVLLIYGAYYPGLRPLILIVVGLSKLNFVVLALVHGAHRAMVAIASDSLMIVLFLAYLLATRESARTVRARSR